MNYWLLLSSPDKWFGEKNQDNYKVNETLYNLKKETWTVQEKYFRDVSIDDKCIIKVGKDSRPMVRRTLKNGDVIDSLEAGIYAIGKISKIIFSDNNIENRVEVEITDNLFAKNSIIKMDMAEKVLGIDYSSFYSKKIIKEKYLSIQALIDIEENTELIEDGDEDIEVDNSDNTLYPAEVKIQRDMFSVRELKTDYEEKILELAPDFQREFVWTVKQKSELIESILMGIPLPMIYFFEADNGVLQVVDGKQRLTSLFQFIDDKFPLSPSLSILLNHKGLRYSELTPSERTKIARHQFVTQTIIPPTPDRIKFDIFERVNRKGSTLNNQEMRNALYQGKASKLLEDLAINESFQIATNYGISPTRMRDRYMILRFISFYLYKQNLLKDKENNLVEYKSDIDEFVGKTMSFLNIQDDIYIENLSSVFYDTMKLAFKLRGKNVFRIPSKERKRPINMALMDSLGYLISQMIGIDNSKHNKIIDDLLDNEEYLNSLTQRVDNRSSVEVRFDKIDEILKEL
ncbi:MAG: DUF262 domain-containing protein [Epsilonproteobacteria bacterium]|nr:MAG: DUF262 domain-containing protein [Campylobacterota bacterium]